LAPWREVALADEIEAKFLARLVARDERAFNELVRAYERRVYSVVFRLLGNRAEAEDLAQEVFVQVFKAIDGFRGDAKLSTWIYRIAVNLCKNRTKYLRVRQTDAQDALDTVGDREPLAAARASSVSQVERPDEMVAGRQVESIVKVAILELEPTFRECLVLRDVEELGYDEIADITGLPLGTVKSRIFRARAQLRARVEEALGEKLP